MEEQTKIEEVADNFKKYLNTNIELIKMEVIESTSVIAANLISGLIITIVGVFFVLFLSLGAAFFLSSYFGDFCLGFASVSIFYFILWLIFIIGRNKFFEKPLTNSIIRKIFQKK